jgi:hypothetical protein
VIEARWATSVAAGRELRVEAIELRSEEVEPADRLVAALAEPPDLLLLTPDATIRLAELAAKRSDLALRAAVLVDERSDRFLESLEVVNVDCFGNRPTPAQASTRVPVSADGRQRESA